MITVLAVIVVAQVFFTLLVVLNAWSKTAELEDTVPAMGPLAVDTETEWRKLMAAADTVTCDNIVAAELAISRGRHPSVWSGE